MDYPVVSDGVYTFKSHEYGQRSIQIGDSVYQTFANSVFPWLAKPYQYAHPYVAQADSFGDKTLEKLDARFPIVKKPTNELYNETKGYVLLPYQKGLEGKDHVFQVYNNEFKKNEQPGLIAYGRAAVTTALVVSNETLSWISSFLSAKKAEAATAVNNATEKAN